MRYNIPTMNPRLDELRTRAYQAPAKPGVYLMRDAEGQVIYVGKAVNLRNRLRSYFQPSAARHSIKVRRLLERLHDLEWIVVGSELEALILEMNLIKKHRPRYNIQLKDDKRYPYIKIHWADPFPKVSVTRRVVQDGSRYYGPYTSVWAVHQTLNALRKIFPYLTCNRTITGRDTRACLYYDIGLCAGPCIGAIGQEDYRAMIADLGRFLEGDTEAVLQRLEAEMRAAAQRLEFEKAARLRDQIRAMQRITEKQRIVSDTFADADVLALARDQDEAVVQIFFIRGGKLIGREYFVLENTADEPEAEVLAAFLKRFYGQASADTRPREVLLPQDLEEARLIEQWLRQQRRGPRLTFRIPQREDQRALLDLVAQNAAETLAALRARWEAERHRHTEALARLQAALGLDAPPQRIEGYDVSTLHGTATTVSLVVFEQGAPAKRLYRRFNIRTVTGTDDYAALEEALTRRFARWQAAQQRRGEVGYRPDATFGRLPDLLLIDGGRGQLNRARAVLERFGLADRLPVVALAKREEVVFVPDRPAPLRLERDDPALHLLQRVRDEAHRFALEGHRRRRQKQGLASALEDIPGVGPKRRRALLQHFGSLDALQQASVEAIAAVPGIPRRVAQAVWEHLHAPN
ncbi:MAG: excinuclease ABC subunit UvrC [Chloroflexi bacterium]|nr:excinuclease ABC subunit UvrC [Chloroflexota bacterium]